MTQGFFQYLYIGMLSLFLLSNCKNRDVLDEREGVQNSNSSGVAKSQELAETKMTPDGKPHVMPIRHPGDAGLSLTVGTPHLNYYGGRVLEQVEVVPVFWGPSVDPITVARIANFFAAITVSDFFDWLAQYNTTLPGGTNQKIIHGSTKSGFTITPSRTQKIISENNLALELDQQIAAGNLPPPSPNTIYMTYFPSGFTATTDTLASCVDICGYHGTAYRTTGEKFLYAAMPDLSDAGCNGGCGGSTAVFDNLTSVSSHELIEAVTDPDVGFATIVGPPLAWYDQTNGEIADICNGQQGKLKSTIDGTIYTVQKEWSNVHGACITALPAPTSLLTANFLQTPLPVRVGDIVSFGWSSTFANVISSALVAPANDTCGSTMMPSGWPTTAASGRGDLKIPACASGKSYTYTFTADNGFGQKSQSSLTLTIFPVPAPTATLTVNNLNGTLSVNVGDPLNFAWASSNAISASSTVSVDGPDTCPTSTSAIPWIASSTSGSASLLALPCQGAHVYTYTYTATNSLGQTATASTKVTVRGGAPQAVLKVNGLTASASVHPGTILNFDWTSLNASTASSTFKAVSKDKCRTPITAAPWLIKTLSGTMTQPVLGCMAGHTYIYNYTVKNQSGIAKTASFRLSVLPK